MKIRTLKQFIKVWVVRRLSLPLQPIVVFGESLGFAARSMGIATQFGAKGTHNVGMILYYFAKLIGAKKTVEVGSRHGFVSLVLGLHAKEVGGTHYGIDIVPEFIERLNEINRTMGTMIVPVLSDGGLCPNLSVFIAGVIDPIDLCFIDGDHSYEGVKFDIDCYGPLVRKGGIIAFHDYHRFDGVTKAVREYEDIDFLGFIDGSGLALGIKK